MQLEEARIKTNLSIYSWDNDEQMSILSIHVSIDKIPSLIGIHWWSLIQSLTCQILQLGSEEKSRLGNSASTMQINNSNISVNRLGSIDFRIEVWN